MSEGKTNRFIHAAGAGLQAAGGEVTASRAGATLLHAGASMFGLQDKTKEMFNRSSRPNVTLTDADIADLNEENKDMKL